MRIDTVSMLTPSAEAGISSSRSEELLEHGMIMHTSLVDFQQIAPVDVLQVCEKYRPLTVPWSNRTKPLPQVPRRCMKIAGEIFGLEPAGEASTAFVRV